MDTIGELPHLEVLKLKDFAFFGSKWEPSKQGFRELKALLISRSNLKHWDRSYCLRERQIVHFVFVKLELSSEEHSVESSKEESVERYKELSVGSFDQERLKAWKRVMKNLKKKVSKSLNAFKELKKKVL
nr:putative late blight resistance protein homolog R1C-3 isoform X2 [Ipomoea batatas]